MQGLGRPVVVRYVGPLLKGKSMSDEDLGFMTAVEAVRRIRAKEISPVELTDAVLRRAEAVQNACNAFITISDDVARAEAKRAEDAGMAGNDLGPLQGVPFTVKDLVNTADVKTTFGSHGFAANVPATDSIGIARLRAAGAVLMLIPGYITDAMGLVLFIPGIRTIIGASLISRMMRRGSGGFSFNANSFGAGSFNAGPFSNAANESDGSDRSDAAGAFGAFHQAHSRQTRHPHGDNPDDDSVIEGDFEEKPVDPQRLDKSDPE